VLSLNAEDVRKRFADGTVALDGVDLDVKPGERVVLLGPNGSGKSTLLRCVVGLEEATAGRILVGGVEVTSARGGRLREVRRKVGFVFQAFNLVGNLSAFHNVLQGSLGRSRGPWCWFPATAPAEERERVMRCLERVGLERFAARRADALSGGQQQKLALARMLMQDPQMILADEPVANLDPKAGREVMDLMWELARERGLTIVCTLHQLDLARRYGDRLVGLHNGRLVLDGRPQDLDDEVLGQLYGEELRERVSPGEVSR
jgi:phosphonate transport system ATP-binding protein